MGVRKLASASSLLRSGLLLQHSCTSVLGLQLSSMLKSGLWETESHPFTPSSYFNEILGEWPLGYNPWIQPVGVLPPQAAAAALRVAPPFPWLPPWNNGGPTKGAWSKKNEQIQKKNKMPGSHNTDDATQGPRTDTKNPATAAPAAFRSPMGLSLAPPHDGISADDPDDFFKRHIENSERFFLEQKEYAVHPKKLAELKAQEIMRDNFPPKMEAEVGQTREGFPIYANGPRNFGERKNSVNGKQEVPLLSRSLKSFRWFTDAWNRTFLEVKVQDLAFTESRIQGKGPKEFSIPETALEIREGSTRFWNPVHDDLQKIFAERKDENKIKILPPMPVFVMASGVSKDATFFYSVDSQSLAALREAHLCEVSEKHQLEERVWVELVDTSSTCCEELRNAVAMDLLALKPLKTMKPNREEEKIMRDHARSKHLARIEKIKERCPAVSSERNPGEVGLMQLLNRLEEESDMSFAKLVRFET